ncbi:MAG: DUF1249 domain-containing protein [Gammaproteobacteria bacterium]
MSVLDQTRFGFASASAGPNLNPVNKSRLLHGLCENNFHKLFRLAPDLLRIRHGAAAQACGRPALHIRILERQPYTLTLELTHHFESEPETRTEPAVKIRVYLDAKSAEVLREPPHHPYESVLKKNPDPKIVLDYKWTINYFLEKWLDHCIDQGYRFDRLETGEALLL